MAVLQLIEQIVREAFFMFWETLWALVLGFGLSGAVQAFISRAEMQRALGGQDIRSLARATFFGMISSSCSYAASAMAKSLFQKGANFTAAMVFMFASTNLVIELGLVLWVLIGWQFTVSEFVGGLIMITLLALVSRFVFTPAVVEAARRRLQPAETAAGHHGHAAPGEEASIQTQPLRERLSSLAGWSDAASYSMADITMLRNEMLIGYLVAGVLTVVVPTTLWSAIFLTGHGFWTTLENVVVGPVIAFLSFVCSIGNVPLAAALWKGGISFGGAISFIFADLIAFPLVLIYRKFYGGKLALRLVATAWVVMAAAGLIVEYLFRAINLVPVTRPAQIVTASFEWNYTTILNIIFLALFALLFWLSRNRARFGGGAGYTIDPVCGMQVQPANAPASTVHAGQHYYFCSDRCAEAFNRNPARYTGPGAAPTGMPDGAPGDAALDPVCGMTVDKEHAAATRTVDGATTYFCSTGCAEQFDQHPERYAAPAATAIDPVCGMTVEKEDAAAIRTRDGETTYFCSTGCADTFDQHPERYQTVAAAPPSAHGGHGAG